MEKDTQVTRLFSVILSLVSHKDETEIFLKYVHGRRVRCRNKNPLTCAEGH